MLKLKTHLTKYSNSQVQSKKHNNQRTKNTKKNQFSAEEKKYITNAPDYCKKTKAKAFTSASQANWVLGNEETQRECESV